jgi:hypothetical protein
LIIDVNTPEGIEQILNLPNSNKKNIIQVVTRAILDEGIPKVKISLITVACGS